MDHGTAVVVMLLAGLVLGASTVLVFSSAWRNGRRALAVMYPSVPDGVDAMLSAVESAGVVVDPSSNVIKASPGAIRAGLVAHDQLAVEEFVEIAHIVQRTGEPVVRTVEVKVGQRSDVALTYRVRASRLGARYVLLLAEDQTEAIRLENVRRDFVANVSHELKTPIGAISLLAEALEQASDDPAMVRHFASRLIAEAGRLGKLTREIIELSRLQAKDPLKNAKPVRLLSVVEAAVDANRVSAEKRGIQIVAKGDKKARTLGDDALLRVMVGNLVSNAVNYSPDGGRVGVGVRADGDEAEISVTDQGIGIDAADIDRIFERFYRVDPARSRVTGGTGLGLSIVKHIAENHGGDVRVWSVPGQGSTFTVRVPLSSAGKMAVQFRNTDSTDGEPALAASSIPRKGHTQ